MLTHRQEQLLRQLRHRHGRKQVACCLGEGLRCCREMLALRPDLFEFALCAASFPLARDLPGLVVTVLPDQEFAQWSTTVATQGVLVVMRRPAPPPAPATPPQPWVPVLDRIADPGNLGTILRTVRAVGVTEAWLTAGTADPFSDKVIRAALAAQFALVLREFPDLAAVAAELRRRGGGPLFRTDPHGGVTLFAAPDLFAASAIVLGSEAAGAGELNGTLAVTIPMPGGGESLNVAQAATMFCGEFIRRGLNQ